MHYVLYRINIKLLETVEEDKRTEQNNKKGGVMRDKPFIAGWKGEDRKLML